MGAGEWGQLLSFKFQGMEIFFISNEVICKIEHLSTHNFLCIKFAGVCSNFVGIYQLSARNLQLLPPPCPRILLPCIFCDPGRCWPKEDDFICLPLFVYSLGYYSLQGGFRHAHYVCPNGQGPAGQRMSDVSCFLACAAATLWRVVTFKSSLGAARHLLAFISQLPNSESCMSYQVIAPKQRTVVRPILNPCQVIVQCALGISGNFCRCSTPFCQRSFLRLM